MKTVSKTVKAGEKSYKDKDGQEQTITWPEGKIELAVPDLSTWDEEDVKAFAEAASRAALQHGPSSLHRAGKAENAQFETIDGVFHFKPGYRPGEGRSSAKREALEAKIEELSKDGPLPDAVVDALYAAAGLKR